MRLSPELQESARLLIADRLGLCFPEQREDELRRKLLIACNAEGVSDVGRYVSRLASLPGDSPEWKVLASHLTVGETYFLRNQEFMDTLEGEILPSLIRRRREQGTRRLRLWSAGCSTGEEPYSLAILLDRLLPDRADWSLTILATDVDARALAAAERGLYREWSFRATPAWVRQRYFRPRGSGTYELDPAIRRMVTFAPLNLSEDNYPSLATNTTAMDLILCRNVVMYFTPETQRAAARRFHAALVAGGWLALSPAEASAELLRPLEPVSFPGAVLFRKPPTVPDAAPGSDRGARPARVRVPAIPPSAPEPTAVAPPAETGVPLLQRAAAEAGRGELDLARGLCLDAIAQNRLDPEAYVLLAAVEQERGDLDAAVQAIRRAIYLAPESASAHFVLGSLLRRQGDERRARTSMETVVSLLAGVPPDEQVPGADGLTAGRLIETAGAYLEAS